jgi:hypothetical protein
MKTYQARIRVRAHSGAGSTQKLTQVNANSTTDARVLLEAMYGQGCVVGIVVLIS